MTRFAREGRVLFYEEPHRDSGPPRLDVVRDGSGVYVATPRLPGGLPPAMETETQRDLLDGLLADLALADDPVLWYYTPMMRSFTRHLRAGLVVYDCMDELSLFAGAPPELREREAELFAAADLVFTGGLALYEHKRATTRHQRVYPFPSSVDAPHFARARAGAIDPGDQAPLPRPRLGFFGVIDERMDIDLVARVADARPDWQLVLIGPVVKIDPAVLPRRPNIHYLGSKPYVQLPDYLAGWDVALLPFARNDATRFISPTKTPEYLAAGCPVVSTSIRDVVRPYGELRLARIADTPDDFVAACTEAMAESRDARLARVDTLLAQMSWDRTWGRMRDLVDTALAARRVAGRLLAEPGRPRRQRSAGGAPRDTTEPLGRVVRPAGPTAGGPDGV
jgi:UDP-galactopyranose mutase